MLSHIPKNSIHETSNLSKLALVVFVIGQFAIPAAVSAATLDVPTGGAASPLFNAAPFSQQFLRFEEFGTEPLPSNAASKVFPAPIDAQNSPVGPVLDSFLNGDLYPAPSVEANTTDLNPWKIDIEGFMGQVLNSPPAEGRPGGAGWAHQRWDEFPPEVYFETAQATARINQGGRDAKQTHGYALGEFAPGGLYHNTVGAAGFEGTTNGISVKFHPNFPVQTPQSLWTFDGTFPPKLLKAKYGEAILMRHYNALPIDPAANGGFGLHTISTHEHNGHNPAESDGYANAFFFPGQYYDYRWPMQLAGYDTVNTTATSNLAGSPDGNGGITKLRGDYRETMSTHWFHDHMLDYTAQNVYKGNAVMMNYYSAIDRGNESIDDGINLRLPSGSNLDFGNRDYDVNMVIADKAWDASGQLWFNIFNLDGFVGDVMTVNWLYKPYMDVRARRYRFRMLNGSVSRYIKTAVVDQNGNPVPVYMIANDGNIMEHSVLFADGILPTQSIAERYDIIIDFSAYEAGTKIYFVNLMEHYDGAGPNTNIALADVLSGAYQANIDVNGNWIDGDPAVGKFMELRVQNYTGTDQSMNPANYLAGGQTMIPTPTFTQAELDNALHRTFKFGNNNGTDEQPWTIQTDGGTGLAMDPQRISAAPNLQLNAEGLGHVEIWSLDGGATNWSHPIHIHFEEGKILSRDGKAPPDYEQFARKDVFRLGVEVDSSSKVDIAIRFREFAGTYMEHCHNTQHEDHAMLMRWDLETPGQVVLLPTPMPTWDGVNYVDSFALDTARTGDGK